MLTLREIAYDLAKKDKKLKKNEIKSMKIAVEQAGIPAIHPDKLEDFAEHLVRQVRESEKPVAWRKGSACLNNIKGDLTVSLFLMYNTL